MGIFNRTPKIAETVVNYKPYVIGEATEAILKAVSNPNFKGEVKNDNIKFPVDLGIEHPFNFETVEGLYRKYGLVTASVDKYIDFIVGPGFFVTSKEENGDAAVEIITNFM